jgi:hypothetical protein
MRYRKDEALALLRDRVGYKEYGRKHGESIFTKFFQNYYEPHKFGYDKRRAHLSSIILSGQLSRDEAVLELNQALYDEIELKSDLEYIAKKLRLTVDELKSLIDGPGVDYRKYRNWDSIYARLKKIQALAEGLSGKKLRNYS